MSSKDVAQIDNLQTLVDGYNRCSALIEQGYKSLREASDKYDAYFNRGPYTSDFAMPPRMTLEKLQADLLVNAWRRVYALSGAPKLVSKKRARAFDESCENGELPPFTVPDIQEYLQTLTANSARLAQETVVEVFRLLTPGRLRYGQRLKTNSGEAAWKIGDKVILSSVVEERGWPRRPGVYYSRQDDLIQLDRVFHLLDGAGVPEGYQSPLVDAINTIGDYGETGETAYFRFKAFRNGNLHLWFKRPDLVKQINGIAGSGEAAIGATK